MAIPLTINGAVFEYPQNFDEDWGVDATGWAQAVTAGALYLSGGNFPLTSMVDFGSSFGIKVKSITSKTANPAVTGYMELAKTDAIAFRNNANSADLLLAINGSDALTFNGAALGLTSLANGDIFVGNASNVPAAVALSGDATLINTGALTISNGAITNAKVASGAAIAVNKLAALTASKAVQTDSSGFLQAATVTSTELGYLSGVTGPIQTQLGTYLPLVGGTMSGAINMASNKLTAVTQGTATGEAISFPAGTAQIAANAVTQVQSSSSNGASFSTPTTITTVSITTQGGPVIVSAQASVQLNPQGSPNTATFKFGVTGGGANTPYAIQPTFTAPTSNVVIIPVSVYIVDTPTAGTYTYAMKYEVVSGISAAIAAYSLVVTELKR